MKKNNDVQLQRVYEKPLTLFGKAVRVKRLMLITSVGMILGTAGYLEVQAIAWAIFSVLNLIIFIAVFQLFQKSILYFKEYSLEATASGDIFITKLHGHCSRCDGHLRIVKKRKGLNDIIAYIQCDKNPKHVWNLYKDDKSK